MKIKPLLQKTFLWDTSAEEAFFALTLWGVGLYLTFSAVLWLWVEGFIPTPFLENGNDGISVTVPIVWGWAASLSIYAVWRFACFYFDVCRPRWWLISSFFGIIILYLTGLYVIGHNSATDAVPMGWVIVTSTFVFWIFPALLLTRVRCRSYFANALTWSSGGLIIAFVATYAHFYFKEVKFGGDPRYTPWEDFCIGLAQWYHLAGTDWLWLTLLGLGLLLAGYLLTAKLFAEAARIPLCRMFGRAVLTLWVLAAITYLVFLVMALRASGQAAQNVKDLEQRFGRPVNMETLAVYYFTGDRPNAEFWRQIKVLKQRCCAKNTSGIPNIVPPGLALEWRQMLETTRDPLEQWEKMFAGVIPPDNYQFRRGQGYEIWSPMLWSIHQFCIIELKKLYLALLDGDTGAALKIYRQMKHAEDSMLRQFGHNTNTWKWCLYLRLRALQWLLESGKLSGDELAVLSSDLQTTEQTVPVMAERMLYGEAVQFLDIFNMYGEGTNYHSDMMTLPLQSLRCIMPQLWWYAAMDKVCATGIMKNIDQDTDAAKRQIFVVSRYVSSLPLTDKVLRYLTMDIRAAEVMIRAARYRLEHGSYPEYLDDLPLDLKSGKMLQYSKGEFPVKLDIADKFNDNWNVYGVTETIPAVVCWQPQTQADKPGAGNILFWLRIKP